METADVVLRFLESVGRRSEADFYLALFRSEPKERFAAVSVDANVARHATDAVVLDLRFLAALGLTPLVVLGLFEPTDAPEHAARIRKRLEKTGVRTESVGPDAAEVIRCTSQGVIPVLSHGLPDGRAETIAAAKQPAAIEQRFGQLGALLAALQTRKLLFLHRPGGLRQKGALVTLVNLTTDTARMLESKELSPKERTMVVQSRRLVFELVPHKLLISITSPLNLLRELFTVKGAGTLLRRGAQLTEHEGIAGLDRERLKKLLASAFGRAPDDAFFERPLGRAWLVDGYRGAALLAATPLGDYLTKFAVDREAQGEGLARDLWDALSAAHPQVFWRARAQNPIVDWYGKLADGLHRAGDWVVFWRGLPPERIPEAIAYALAQPIDIPTAGPDGG